MIERYKLSKEKAGFKEGEKLRLRTQELNKEKEKFRERERE